MEPVEVGRALLDTAQIAPTIAPTIPRIEERVIDKESKVREAFTGQV
jgi:hypothetical protein